MAWYVECKTCRQEFQVSKPSVSGRGKFPDRGELVLNCEHCGAPGRYSAGDLASATNRKLATRMMAAGFGDGSGQASCDA